MRADLCNRFHVSCIAMSADPSNQPACQPQRAELRMDDHATDVADLLVDESQLIHFRAVDVQGPSAGQATGFGKAQYCDGDDLAWWVGISARSFSLVVSQFRETGSRKPNSTGLVEVKRGNVANCPDR